MIKKGDKVKFIGNIDEYIFPEYDVVYIVHGVHEERGFLVVKTPEDCTISIDIKDVEKI